MVTRRTICRTGKMGVAETSTTAMRSQPALSVCVTVKQQFIRLRIKHLGAHGHAHNHICAFFPRTVAALSVHTAAGNMERVVTQMQQCIQLRVSDDPDVPPPASVTARGPSAWDELLAPKSSHAVAAVAPLKPNFYAIDEHFENFKRTI